MLKFETSAVLPCSAAALRQFLGCPANLPEISDPDLELQILSAPETVQAGARIEFRIMSFGLRHRMAHEYRQVTETEIFEVLVDGVPQDPARFLAAGAQASAQMGVRAQALARGGKARR